MPPALTSPWSTRVQPNNEVEGRFYKELAIPGLSWNEHVDMQVVSDVQQNIQHFQKTRSGNRPPNTPEDLPQLNAQRCIQIRMTVNNCFTHGRDRNI
jgi:hypothetical protein